MALVSGFHFLMQGMDTSTVQLLMALSGSQATRNHLLYPHSSVHLLAWATMNTETPASGVLPNWLHTGLRAKPVLNETWKFSVLVTHAPIPPDSAAGREAMEAFASPTDKYPTEAQGGWP